ncbi:DNA-binding CsgD family transcriptional regulator [Mycetocola sp. 2940]
MSALLRSALDQISSSDRAAIPSGLEALDAVLPLRSGFSVLPEPAEVLLADAVSEFFRRLSAHHRVVLFVDSIESVDAPSARILAVLADRMAGRQTLILLSGRDVAATADVRRLRAQFARSGAVIVRLARLDTAAAAKLVARAAPLGERRNAAQLLKEAHGLPVYLAGALSSPGTPGPPEVPREMRSLVDELATELDESSQELVELLALSPDRGVVPESLMEAVRDGGRRGHRDGDQDLRRLVDVGLAELRPGPPERLALRHPAFAQVLLEPVSAQEQRAMRRRLMAVIRAQKRDPVVLAAQCLAMRDEMEPFEVAEILGAAADCHTAGSDDVALFLTELLAIPALTAEPSELQLRYEQLAAAQQELGDLEGADASLSRALELEAAERTPRGALASARTQIGLTSWETGKYAPATSEPIPGSPPVDIPPFHHPSYRVLNKLIWCTRHGTNREARAAAREAMGCARLGKEGEAVAALGRCADAALDGEHRRAAAHAGAARDAAWDVGLVDVRTLASVMLLRFAPLCGDMDRAAEAGGEMLRDAHAMDLPAPEFATQTWLTLLSHAQGDLIAAEHHRQVAALSSVSAASSRTQAKTALVTALLRAERGDASGTRASLADAQRSYAAGIEEDAGLNSLARYARAVISVQLGTATSSALSGAIQLWGTYPQTIAMLPFFSGLAALKHGDAKLTARRQDELAAQPVESPALAALGVRLRGLTLLQQGGIQEAGELLLRAADTLDTLGLRLYAAQTRLEWAETLLDARSAADPVRQLLVYFRSQQVQWWLQRTRSLARHHRIPEDRPSRGDSVLTPRQVDVVRLAAEGLSNAQIASQLFLSERTVETHLHVAYQRLGVSARSGLSTWASENIPEFSTGTDTRLRPGP